MRHHLGDHPAHMSREMSRPAPSLVKSSCKSAPEVVGTTCALATPWVDENRRVPQNHHSGNERSWSHNAARRTKLITSQDQSSSLSPLHACGKRNDHQDSTFPRALTARSISFMNPFSSSVALLVGSAPPSESTEVSGPSDSCSAGAS